jgi:branched-chain amino acid transport system ATP-binding protein
VILGVESIHCYYGLSHVLHGVSLEVDAGEIVSLLGRNGAGKTTMIETVMGLVECRSGQILVADHPVTGLTPHEVCRNGVGWVPQGRRIFPHLTVEENIRLATLKPSRVGGFDAFERIYSLFPILHTRGGVLAGRLSGGEQQMLAIGRALMATPDLILMDEPSEGLSPRLVLQVQEIMRRLKILGHAILLVEQNLELALAVADEVYVLSSGRFVFQGTPAALANEPQILDQHLGISGAKMLAS